MTTAQTHRKRVCRLCRKQHATYRNLATCRWPAAVWITGDGPFALVAACPPLSVRLFATRAAALEAKEDLGESGCGSGCRNLHLLIDLDQQ